MANLVTTSPCSIAWLRYDQSNDVPSATPYFWQGQSLTWQIMARVNDDAYCLFGCAGSSLSLAQQTGISFTSTRTLITLTAGSATFVLDFFSPVSLTDYVRQSIPYSYVRVEVQHQPRRSTIDVLMAIDDTWTSQQPDTQAEFFKSWGGSLVFTLSGKNSYTWAENDNMAAWGNVVLAASSTAGSHVSYQVGRPEDIATQFKNNGTLIDDATSYSSGDLVALAYRLHGSLRHSSPSVTFAIGLEQENALNWLEEPQTGYYQATVSGTGNVVDHFFKDEAAARVEGYALDKRVIDIGHQISTNYSDILESCVRQVSVPYPYNNQ